LERTVASSTIKISVAKMLYSFEPEYTRLFLVAEYQNIGAETDSIKLYSTALKTVSNKLLVFLKENVSA
jgi:hypothetical protein